MSPSKTLVAQAPTTMALATLLSALALLVAPPAATAEGLPVIDFVSQGGVVSDQYVVNVTVIGDLAAGQVFYGVDTGDPNDTMTSTGQYHYEATIDATVLSEGDHHVTVKAVNTTGANVTRSQTFTVDHTGPVVEVTSPVPEYVVGDHTVTASVDDEHVDPDAVMLVIDGNRSDGRAMADMGDRFEYVLNSTELMCGPHVLRVCVQDLGGNRGCSENTTLQVDNCRPMVEFLSHGGHVMGIYQLHVNVSDAYMDADKVWGVFDGDVINKTRLDPRGEGGYTYSFDTTTMSDGDHEITVLAVDLVGWTTEAGPLVLMVDNNPPASRILVEGGNVSGYFQVEASVSDPYINDSAVHVVVDDDDANATQMVWAGDRFEATIDTRDLMDGNRTVRVWATDMWGQESRSPPVVLDVDNNPPTVRILSGKGVRWGDYQVRANVTDPHLDRGCIKVRVGDGEPVQMKAREEYWYYDVDTRELPDGLVTIMVMACDLRGNRNDMVTVTITVSNKAELEIVSVDWVDTKLEEGETAKVQVRVRNAGHSTAKDYRVELRSGGETLAYTEELTGIRPGKVHTYTLEWKTAGVGNRVVRIEVDTTDAIDESDEENNAWEKQTITITSGGSSVPGMGAALAALAMTGLACWSARRRA